MAKPYLITFTPISRFFFGSSYSLGEGFYAESMKLPQQTTILGCIRTIILLQKGLVDPKNKNFPNINSEEAKKLTGTSKIRSFDDPDDNFGIIEKISPVFIVKRRSEEIEDFLFQIPKNVVLEDGNLKQFGYIKQQGLSYYSKRKFEHIILSERKPKTGVPDYFGGREFWFSYINNKIVPYKREFESNSIFISRMNIGIKKMTEGAFYTKIDYTLKRNFSFGVIVWFSEPDIENDIVVLGGERSTFKMEIFKIEDSFKSHPVVREIVEGECDFTKILSTISSPSKLIALSPIILDEESFDEFEGMVGHMIVNGIHSTRIMDRIKGVKSQAIRMIPAGSVFYVEKGIRLKNEWTIPYKIGYNYIIKINL